MTRIETIIEFEYGIPCKKDVLGAEFPIMIGELRGTIAFPNLPENFNRELKEVDLRPPKNSKLCKTLYDYDKEWGRITDSQGNSYVKKCMIWFPCTAENYKDISLGINEKTNNYIDQFILFVEVLARIAIDENSCKGLYITGGSDYLYIDEYLKISSADITPYAIVVTINPDSDFVPEQIIRQAIEHTNSNHKICDDHLFLRDSIFHKNRYEFRRAILDATTAIEIALTKRILVEFKHMNVLPDGLINSVLKKFHSLRGRIELMQSLDIELPLKKSDYLDFLSNVRNRAIHAGYQSNLDEVKKVIVIATRTIDQFGSDFR